MKTASLLCAAFFFTASLAAAEAGHGHEGHDHEQTAGHGHGAEVALGSQAIAAWTVAAARLGEIVAGGEAVIELEVTPAAPKPTVARAWIGAENGRGSVKAKLGVEDEGFHGHVEVPAELPTDSKLWISLQDDAGTQHVGSFALDAAAAE